MGYGGEGKRGGSKNLLECSSLRGPLSREQKKTRNSRRGTCGGVGVYGGYLRVFLKSPIRKGGSTFKERRGGPRTRRAYLRTLSSKTGKMTKRNVRV